MTKQSAAVRAPTKHRDGQWATKIEKAKQARAAGREMRKGKPVTVRSHRSISRDRVA